MTDGFRFLLVIFSAFLVSLVLYRVGVTWDNWMLILIVCVVLACIQSLVEELYDWWRGY